MVSNSWLLIILVFAWINMELHFLNFCIPGTKLKDFVAALPAPHFQSEIAKLRHDVEEYAKQFPTIGFEKETLKYKNWRTMLGMRLPEYYSSHIYLQITLCALIQATNLKHWATTLHFNWSNSTGMSCVLIYLCGTGTLSSHQRTFLGWESRRIVCQDEELYCI